MDLLLIFCMQVLFVTTTTMRWIILIKGNYKIAASISFFEVIIWVYALSLVVTQLHDPIRIVVYAAGYSVGSMLGGKLEERLAYGHSILQIITQKPSNLPQILRDEGFGVTNWSGAGRGGDREVILVLFRRKLLHRINEIVAEHDPHAFTLILEPRAFKGGFLAKSPIASMFRNVPSR